MIRNARKNRTLNKFSPPMEVQSLEHRTLPTGIVSVGVSAEGDIVFTGDVESNIVDVNIDDAGVHVTGRYGTKVKYQNSTVAAGTTVTFQEPAVIRDLRVNLKEGNDTITLKARSALFVTRDLKIDTGIGSDNVAVHAHAGITVAHDALINTGSGNDRVQVDSRGGLIHVKNNLSVNTSIGNDAVRLANANQFWAVDDATSFNAVADNTGVAFRQKIRVGGHLSVVTGAGTDEVAVLGAEVTGNASINTSVDRDVVGVSNLRVGGNLALWSADASAVQNLTVAGAFNVSGSELNDRVFINKARLGSLNVNLADGNDQLAIGAKVVVSGSKQVNGGIGIDTISSSLASTSVVSFQVGFVNSLNLIDDVLAAIAMVGI